MWLLYGCDSFDEIVMSCYVVTMGCDWLHCGRNLVVMWLRCGYHVLVRSCDDCDEILMSCNVVAMGCDAVTIWL